MGLNEFFLFELKLESGVKRSTGDCILDPFLCVLLMLLLFVITCGKVGVRVDEIFGGPPFRNNLLFLKLALLFRITSPPRQSSHFLSFAEDFPLFLKIESVSCHQNFSQKFVSLSYNSHFSI